jgi:hypothetical protein
MYNFTSQIAASKKFPSLTFGFKSLDPTILKNYPPMPEGVKLAVG